MPTAKQKKLARAIIENTDLPEPLNKGELVEAGGYSKVTAETKPGFIIDQKGVKEALQESGFTEENAKKVVEEIMLDVTKDPGSRLKASDMVFKVHGTYAAEKSVALNVNVDAQIPSNEAENLRLEYEEKLKAKWIGS